MRANDARSTGPRTPVFIGRLPGSHGTIIDLGKKKLKIVAGIVHTTNQTTPIVAGHAYPIHCLDRRDRDFYVAMRVKQFKGSKVVCEWKLLTAGKGAPKDLKTATAPQGRDGADGVAGLCGKHGR